MKSPLFNERFAKDNWTLVYFNPLREAFTKSKGKTELEPLFGKKKSTEGRLRDYEDSGHQVLFELPESGGAALSAGVVMK
jgi:hypothetical protein